MLDALNRGLEAPLIIKEIEESGMEILSCSNSGILTIRVRKATSDIEKHGFIFKLQKEYDENDEAAKIVQMKEGKATIYFNETSRFNQFGTYVNHSTSPNCRLVPPLFVRGKKEFP